MKRFLVNIGVLAITAGILTACQTTTGTTSQTYAQSVFDSFYQRKDMSGKDKLLNALDTHINHDYYSLSKVYYRESPLDFKGSLDENADPLFLSIIKTRDFKLAGDDNYKDTAYRTMGDYLPIQDQDSQLYLRYYDEIGDTKPDNYTLTKSQGVQENSQWRDNRINELHNEYNSCVTSISYKTDMLVSKNPNIHNNNKDMKAVHSELASCYQPIDDAFDKLQSSLNAYQASDVAIIRQCATSYQTDLNDAFAKNRVGRYDNLDEAYEGVYANYAMCEALFVSSYRQDPMYYIDNGLSQNKLNAINAQRACALTAVAQDKALKAQGNTFANNPQLFVDNIRQFVECTDAGVRQVYGEKSTLDLDNLKKGQKAQDALNNLVFDSEYKAKYGEDDKKGGLFADYQAMKQTELDSKSTKHQQGFGGLGGFYGMMAGQMLENLRQTPEQIHAKNAYQNNHTQVTILSHKDTKNRQLSAIASLEFDAPTASQSVQVPFVMNFNDNTFVVDTTAMLPLSAFAFADSTPLPSAFAKQGADLGVMKFAVPKSISDHIPLPVIYDSIQKGMLAGFEQVSPTAFSVIDGGQDTFASQLSADTVIKFHADSRQIGIILGIISKQVIKDLKDYVDTHAQDYEPANTDNLSLDDERQTRIANLQKSELKSAIDQWALLDKGFVSADVGGLLQVIEGLVPVDFYNVSYYYLKNGKLVGSASHASTEILMLKSRQESLVQTMYSNEPFSHALGDKLGVLSNTKALDGNAFVKSLSDKYKLTKKARELRQSYETTDDLAQECQVISELLDGTAPEYCKNLDSGQEQPTKTPK